MPGSGVRVPHNPLLSISGVLEIIENRFLNRIFGSPSPLEIHRYKDYLTLSIQIFRRFANSLFTQGARNFSNEYAIKRTKK